MCTPLAARSPSLLRGQADQKYLDLAIGSKKWHGDVPSLLENGGTSGVQGRAKGDLYKQMATAQRLNREREEDQVEEYLPSLKRLLNVARVLG